MNAFINNKECSFEEGETILQVARRNGIFIPSLCFYQPLNHKPGTCRVCLVEIRDAMGKSDIVTSCNTPMKEGVSIITNSAEILALQRLQTELVFSDHDQNCVLCSRHGSCELQDLAEFTGLSSSRYVEENSAKRPCDTSTAGIIHDMSKCIRCFRCIDVCRQLSVATLSINGIGNGTHIGVGLASNLENSLCVQCGQCTLVCPTGAITEKDQNNEVINYLYAPDITTVFSFPSALGGILAQEMNIPEEEKMMTGKIIAALRSLGADFVFNSDIAVEILAEKQSVDILSRIKKEKTPLFSSHCPSWINYAEKNLPEIFPFLSDLCSPQNAMGILIKNNLLNTENLHSNTIKHIAITPCLAKKDESIRSQLSNDGITYTDISLTIREFCNLIRRFGIDLKDISSSAFDNPIEFSANPSFGNRNTFSSTSLRTLATLAGSIENVPLTPSMQYENVCEVQIPLSDGTTLKAALCQNLNSAKILCEEAITGKSPYAFIEIMACPGGCVNGGGTLRHKKEFHPYSPMNKPSFVSFYKTEHSPNIHLSAEAEQSLHTLYQDRQLKFSISLLDAKEKLE